MSFAYEYAAVAEKSFERVRFSTLPAGIIHAVHSFVRVFSKGFTAVRCVKTSVKRCQWLSTR